MAYSFHREIESLMPRLSSFARFLTKNASDADDLVQDSVERALLKSSQFTPGTNLRAWMFTIMRNTHINEIRRRARRGVTTDAYDCEDLFPVAADQEDRIELRDVARAYDRLSDDHRKVIELAGIQGRSYREMSELLDVPVGTVRSRLSRARAQLTDMMAEQAAGSFQQAA